MVHKQLQHTVWFIGLVLLQVLILNNIHLLGYATPFLYIYFIIRYDTSISRNGLMLLAFAIGLLVDIFSNTPGMNAAATVFTAFLRPVFLRLFTPRDMGDDFVPSLKTLGTSSFLKYSFVTIFIHHLVLYTMMFFSFADLSLLFLKTIASTVLTIICIIGIEWGRK
ncbi:rod shape-determining protein MreD [Bacteroides sp. 224]|uniref:rod shape-determining protein MreD n=1 Tax=Bacteroides sp. 224 TaxID=2302936 RepID=UPI0013D67EEE|nr:rod shape-determining protein MreD [Bacteroides sp. 224]NDV66799.1 rod shape-determining protein MreD [Bacteroides sp. 224]